MLWPPTFRMDFRSYNWQNYLRIVAGDKTNLDLAPYGSKNLIRKYLSKNYLAYLFLVLAALF